MLDALNGYTKALRDFAALRQQLNASVLQEAQATSTVDRETFGEARVALVRKRDTLLLEIKKNLVLVNAAMRKDLDVEEIDWAAYENSQRQKS